MAIRRQALLIESPNVRGHSSLPGVILDTKRYHSFLTSNAGGAWEENEIHTLTHPTRKHLGEWLAWLQNNADFAFMVFGGHGCHYQELRSTSLLINDNEEALVKEVNPGVLRQVFVVDTCRRFEKVIRAKAALNEQRALAFSAAPDMYRATCRAAFDNAIGLAPEGRTILYSCDLNQIANDDGNGGAFTICLLNSAMNWAFPISRNASMATQIQSVEVAFGLAKEEVQTNYAPQRPVIDKGRADRTYPFAVA